MKYLLFIILSFCISCNNDEPANTAIETNKKNYTFNGISIFKKGLTIEQIKNELAIQKVEFFNVPLTNERLTAFDLKINCCDKQAILYLPNYNIGQLSIADLFLVFSENELAFIQSDLVYDGDLDKNSSLKDFKTFFTKKYGDGIKSSKDSVGAATLFRINKEILINHNDTISIVFDEILQIDTVIVWDFKVPINETVNAINESKKAFRNDLKKLNQKTPKPAPIAGVLGTNNGKHTLNTSYLLFRMEFPNKLDECCQIKETDQENYDKYQKKKYEDGVLKEL